MAYAGAVALAAIGAVGESCLDLVAAEAVMPRNNMVIILGALADTVRTQDIEHLTGLLDTDVVWEGVHPGQRCDGRDQAMRVLGGFFASRELVFDAVEVIARADAVVVGYAALGSTGSRKTSRRSARCFKFSRWAMAWWSAGGPTLIARMLLRRPVLAARCLHRPPRV
jgi:hypothetical protein